MQCRQWQWRHITLAQLSKAKQDNERYCGWLEKDIFTQCKDAEAIGGRFVYF